MEHGLKAKLSRNIWITRKCRINASERLLCTAKYVEFINVYYSIVVIAISVLSLSLQESWLSIAGLIGSIALTISIVYVNATGLRERSMALKLNYISLQMLLDRLTLLADDDVPGVLEIDAEYTELLKTSENHLTIDMYQLRFNAKDDDLKLKRNESVFWVAYRIWSLIWKILLFVFPIVCAAVLWRWVR